MSGNKPWEFQLAETLLGRQMTVEDYQVAFREMMKQRDFTRGVVKQLYREMRAERDSWKTKSCNPGLTAHGATRIETRVGTLNDYMNRITLLFEDQLDTSEL